MRGRGAAGAGRRRTAAPAAGIPAAAKGFDDDVTGPCHRPAGRRMLVAGNRRMHRTAILLAAMALAIVPGIARAQVADTTATRYALASTSEYDVGCYGPCECAVIMVSKLGGTFQLAPTFFDGLYQHYDVRQVSWTMGNGTRVTGSGTYVLGGEFAVTQQMVLDLSVGGAPPLEFD